MESDGKGQPATILSKVCQCSTIARKQMTILSIGRAGLQETGLAKRRSRWFRSASYVCTRSGGRMAEQGEEVVRHAEPPYFRNALREDLLSAHIVINSLLFFRCLLTSPLPRNQAVKNSLDSLRSVLSSVPDRTSQAMKAGKLHQEVPQELYPQNQFSSLPPRTTRPPLDAAPTTRDLPAGIAPLPPCRPIPPWA